MKLITSILKIVILPDTVDLIKSWKDFKIFDFDNSSKLIRCKEMNIGCASEDAMRKLKRKDLINAKEVYNFKKECRPSCLLKALANIKEYTTLNGRLMQSFSCLGPSFMLLNLSTALSRLSNLTAHLVD